MLNISFHRINKNIKFEKYRAFQILEKKTVSQWLIRIMAVVLLAFTISLFLPWTQNIRAKGYVTALNPNDRPQNIQSVIGGKIEKWYVQEGQTVMAGDTILRISESKQDYFDPDILARTNDQIVAKQESSEAYAQKADNLNDQLSALINSKEVKLRQNKIKRDQIYLKITSDSIDLVAAETKLKIAENQLKRINSLYEDGLKSLTDLEAKRLSVQESSAKVISIRNKLGSNNNELINVEANIVAIENEYDNKIAKSKSERMSALSSKYDATASFNKLQSQYNAYEVRQSNYYVTSPINGLITKAMKTGLGELVKEGEDIISIIPTNYDLAVEMYVSPRDMPLMRIGNKVRVQFDGWPAIVFSGWPNSSYGTFSGVVFAIDNNISKNGRYRVLVSQDADDLKWPEEVRVGGGANTITLLSRVKLGYELWRQLNGFPADYYEESKQKDIKDKAPLKKVK